MGFVATKATTLKEVREEVTIIIFIVDNVVVVVVVKVNVVRHDQSRYLKRRAEVIVVTLQSEQLKRREEVIVIVSVVDGVVNVVCHDHSHHHHYHSRLCRQ